MARTKEQIAAYYKAYYQANRERLLEKQRAYDAAHRDARVAYMRAHYTANSDKHKAAVRACRVKPRDMDAAAAVTRYRKEHGLTQAAFARQIVRTQGTVSSWESGQQTIPPHVLALVGAEIQPSEKGGANHG